MTDAYADAFQRELNQARLLSASGILDDKELFEVAKRCYDHDGEVSRMRAEIRQLESDNDDLESEKEDLESDIEKLKRRIEALENGANGAYCAQYAGKLMAVLRSEQRIANLREYREAWASYETYTKENSLATAKAAESRAKIPGEYAKILADWELAPSSEKQNLRIARTHEGGIFVRLGRHTSYVSA